MGVQEVQVQGYHLGLLCTEAGIRLLQDGEDHGFYARSVVHRLDLRLCYS